MKKLLISFLAALLPVMAWSGETSLYKVNYEGLTVFNHGLEFDSNSGVTMEMVADGLAINNPSTQSNIMFPQVVLTDKCLTLQQGHNYIVRLTMKAPSNGGDYEVILGNQDCVGARVSVTASNGFQVIDFHFQNFTRNADADGYIRLLPGLVQGTTIVKEVQFLEVTGSGGSGTSSQSGVVIAEKDWTGCTSFEYWCSFASGQDGDVQVDPDGNGIAINVGSKTGNLWDPQLIVLDGAQLQKGHNYIVRITAKIPKNPDNGQLVVVLGTFESRDQNQVNVIGSDDFQQIDFEFPNFEWDLLSHVVFECGGILGTSIVKKVQVIDMPSLNVNYEGQETFPYLFYGYEGTGATINMVDGCVAINNPHIQKNSYSPTVNLTDDCLSLQKGHDYIVRLTMKVPSNGKYQVGLGNYVKGCWTNYVYLSASDEFQVIDVIFPDFFEDIAGDGHILLQVGEVAGTTIVKDAQLFDVTGIPKCANPEINRDSGKISFKCDTEGVDYVYYFTVGDDRQNGSEIDITKVDVHFYATKPGYLKSEMVTRVINMIEGDLNYDGEVNVADHVRLSDIIMKK